TAQLYRLSLHDALPILLSSEQNYSLRIDTLSACRPLSASTTLKRTSWPWRRTRRPRPRMARKCTKISSPLSRTIKPKPFFTLNRSEEHTSELQSRENLV